MSGLPTLIARAAAAMLPPGLSEWGRAMIAETEHGGGGWPAFRFALGCLRTAVAFRFSSQLTQREPDMIFSPIDRPRRFACLCAAAAVALGFGYMAAAGAPAAYFAMNGAAFLLGLLTLGVIAETGRLGRVPVGAMLLAMAVILVAVALWGVSAGGVTRWVTVGGVSIQPSLILTPVIILGFAHGRDRLSAVAVMVCALALALQPDRAMAGALAAGALAIALAGRGRLELAALAAASLAFGVTMIRADASPAMAFVDQIFFSSFAVHPAAGLAVWCGAALMLVPAVVGLLRDSRQRVFHATFGAVWLAVIAAAALGNYPTPLVGYGGSAILGYLISLIGLPPRRIADEAARGRQADMAGPEPEHALRVGLA